VRNWVSLPYRTTGKIMVLYILILSFKPGDKKTKDSEQNGSKHSQNINCSLFLHGCNFYFVPKYLNFVTFSKNLLEISKLQFCLAFWWQEITIYLSFLWVYF
jgi:hypothetical protein